MMMTPPSFLPSFLPFFLPSFLSSSSSPSYSYSFYSFAFCGLWGWVGRVGCFRGPWHKPRVRQFSQGPSLSWRAGPKSISVNFYIAENGCGRGCAHQALRSEHHGEVLVGASSRRCPVCSVIITGAFDTFHTSRSPVPTTQQGAITRSSRSARGTQRTTHY